MSESQAVRIFDELVASKESKGYRRPGSALLLEAETGDVNSGAKGRELDARELSILERLNEGHTSRRTWPLSRAAWRCGELRLLEAEPLLIGLVGSGDAMLDYCIAWALGQCGSSTSAEALRALEAGHKADSVRRIAGFALLQVLDGANRATAIAECIQQLPDSLQSLATTGPAANFLEQFGSVLEEAGPEASFVLEVVYLIDNEHVRPALLHFLQTVRLEPGYFQRLRHIFKAAELRRDGVVFGLLARRFEVTLSRFRMRGRWYYPKRQLPTTGANPSQAFSQQTRTYLRRRAWRTLNRLAEVGQALDYVRMAAGVLAAFSDEDALLPRQFYRYVWDEPSQRFRHGNAHYDRYATYVAFNWILFGNSRRYTPDAAKLSFECVAPFEPGGDEPLEREDSHPELWNQYPEVVVELLMESRCEPVHHFGVRVLNQNEAFCQKLSVQSLVSLLQTPYEVTNRLGFNLGVARFDAADPDFSLVQAMANCGYQPARQQAFDWVSADSSRFFADSEFAMSLVMSPHAETRDFVRNSLRQVSIADSNAQAMIGRMISALLGLEGGDEGDALAHDIVETLLLVFGHHLRGVSENVIRDLLAHPIPDVQRFAGDLVLGHETFSVHPPDDVIRLLLESEHAAVRGMGVQIIAQLADNVLFASVDLLIGLTRHEKPDIRAAIRPTVKRLSNADTGFGERIAGRLIEALLTPGAAEGVPTHTAHVLRDDLSGCMTTVSAETVWRLLQSRSAPAQEIGGVLLATNVDSANLSVDEIVKLAGHEVLSVREAAWQMCAENLQRLRTESESTARLVDSRWEDSRRFAFDFLREHFAQDGALSIAVLVGICDSVRPDVQQFGREMITRLFQDGQGEEYVLKLSEHPAEPMQLFASTFLEQHATDNPDQLALLAPFFVSVLSRVNRGRVAKTRTMALLERESIKSEPAAAVAAEILIRVSATSAIADRAAAIETLLRIESMWPSIETPLTVKPLEVRGGV